MGIHMDYFELSEQELKSCYEAIQERYENYRSQQLKLDMSRGKPCSEQLALSKPMLNILDVDDSLQAEDGTDCLNYGGIDGIPEAKQLFAEMMGVSPAEVMIGGNASLNMMFDAIARAMQHGVLDSSEPWSKLPKVKFLCPTPGYDRHFAVCEYFNMEMILIDLTPNGPDMDTVERLVRDDEAIKGIWCVPKYSNPDGITYSDQTVDRLARMVTKAQDFRIFWDDAYAVHHLTDQPDHLKNMLSACKEAGNPNRVYMFSSTSKITFPGSGVAILAASKANLEFIRKQISMQTIGPDKVNQLRHVRFLKDMDHLKAHMKKQAAIIKPKFDMVLDKLESELDGKQIAWWNRPNGGYFISLNTLDGCAKEVVMLAEQAGVTLTKAGATYPYGQDPRDRNIRIAPTFPSLSELEKAIDILCLAVQMASIKKILLGRQ